MSSGQKQLVINAQERIVSADHNRSYAILGANFAEPLRYLLDTYFTLESGNGVVAEPSTIETPLRAEIFAGLLVRPQLGNFDLYVDSGVAAFMAPDAAAEESNYKIVRQSAMVTPGALFINPNVSGSIRIDVIECQIDPTTLDTTEARDIYDPVTSLFSSQTVVKTRQGQLTYRVREGTPGAGLPANVAGWLPLCVASVPNAAASNNDVTFWDVRPLLSDRVFGPMGILSTRSEILVHETKTKRVGATDVRWSGVVWATFNGKRVGGILRRGTPGTANDWLNVGDVTNVDPVNTVAEPLSTTPIVYLAFPGNLPRWCVYQQAPSARLPLGPCGIPVVSSIRPEQYTNRPKTGITLPTATGLGTTTTTNACAIMVFGYNGVSQYARGFSQDRKVFLKDSSVTFSQAAYAGTTSIGTVTENPWPANVKGVFVVPWCTVTVPANTNTNFNGQTLIVYADNTATDETASRLLPGTTLVNTTGAGASRTYWPGEVFLPTPEWYPDLAGWPATRRVDFLIGGGLTVTALAVTVTGYQL